MASDPTLAAPIITDDQLLSHWQGHRRVTRRVLEAFPDTELFSFSIGSMRTFGELALELLAMDVPMLEELIEERPREYQPPTANTKEEVLRMWDEHTAQIDALWPRLPAEIFQQTKTVLGQYTSKVYDRLWCVIDNETHHRGQGYVYLRALGIEPPPFYLRD